MFLIISDKNSPNDPIENSELWRELKKVSEIKEHYLSWVAAAIELISYNGRNVNSIEFTIGKEVKNVSRNSKLTVQKTTLQKDVDYEFIFIVMNEFHNMRRFNFYKMQYNSISGARKPKNINYEKPAEETGSNLALLSLLLLLLIPICIWFVVR